MKQLISNNILSRLTLLVCMIFSISVTVCRAQSGFEPPKKSAQTSKSELRDQSQIAKKASKKKSKTAAPKKSRNSSIQTGEDYSSFVAAEETKDLKDMNDYELEVKASRGDINAQYLIGERWVYSEAITDLAKGMGWLQKASEANHSNAQALLGYCFYCLNEPGRAGYYYAQSAKNGNANGQYYLACAYAKGECGMSQDYTKAAENFAAAGQQGHPGAQYAIGIYLYLGLGVDRNLEWSRQWITAAANNGDEDARNFLANYQFTEEASDALIAEIIKQSQESEEVSEPTDQVTDYTKEESPEEQVEESKTPGIQVGRSVETATHRWTLKSIDCQKEGTFIYWTVTSLVSSTWVQATNDEYITVNSNSKKYPVTSFIGLPMKPEKKILRKKGESVEFCAVYPKLPRKTKAISYHGSDVIIINNIYLQR